MNENKEKNNWYDNFVALSAAVVLLSGIAAYGYGAVKSVCEAIKNRCNRHANMPRQTVQNAVPFNTACKKMTEHSK